VEISLVVKRHFEVDEVYLVDFNGSKFFNFPHSELLPVFVEEDPMEAPSFRVHMAPFKEFWYADYQYEVAIYGKRAALRKIR